MDESQEHPVRKILMHALGSGKTLSGLSVAEGGRLPYSFITPASLRENAKKEIDRFSDKKTPSSVLSYTQLAKGTPVTNNSTLVFDEAHRLRSDRSQQTQNAQLAAEKARQVVMLTGTPVVNSPGDIAPLISMAKGTRDQRISPEEFEEKYIDREKVRPGFIARMMGIEPGEVQHVKNEDDLRALLKGHVDYYAPNKPTVDTKYEDHTVEMGPEQTQLYKSIYNDLPWNLRWKMQKDFPLSSQELSRLQFFMAGPRQVGLSTMPFLKNKDPHKAFSQSTKLNKAMELLQDKLKDPRAKALVFSNFIDAGLKPYAAALERAGVPHGVFHGGINDKQRKQLVQDYNENKLRVMLLGPSGAEGLSFKGTQLVQLLDPHWNNVRTRQQQGRGIRFDSHTDLPEDLQNVTVQRFVSQLPLGMKDKILQRIGINREGRRHASDNYLRVMSDRKDHLNEQFNNILKDVGTPGGTPKPNPQDTKQTMLQRLHTMLFGGQKTAEDSYDVQPLLPSPLELPKKEKPNMIGRLKMVKQYSDNREWGKKYSLIHELVNENPNHWDLQEDPDVDPKFVGIRHITGFRYHMPRAYVPPALHMDIRARKRPALTIE